MVTVVVVVVGVVAMTATRARPRRRRGRGLGGNRRPPPPPRGRPHRRVAVVGGCELAGQWVLPRVPAPPPVCVVRLLVGRGRVLPMGAVLPRRRRCHHRHCHRHHRRHPRRGASFRQSAAVRLQRLTWQRRRRRRQGGTPRHSLLGAVGRWVPPVRAVRARLQRSAAPARRRAAGRRRRRWRLRRRRWRRRVPRLRRRQRRQVAPRRRLHLAVRRGAPLLGAVPPRRRLRLAARARRRAGGRCLHPQRR